MAPTCSVCGSRRWRKDRSGIVICEEGHVLENFRVEENDIGEPTRHALIKRTLRKGRRQRKSRRKGEAHPDHFYGDEKVYLRLELLQLLLRHQITALIEAWELPDFVETIARDLWGLVLSVNDVPPPPDRVRKSPRNPASKQTPANVPEAGPSRLSFIGSTQHHHTATSQPLPSRPTSARPRLDTGENKHDGANDTETDTDQASKSSEQETDSDEGIDPDLLEGLSETTGSSSEPARVSARVPEGVESQSTRRGPGRPRTNVNFGGGPSAYTIVPETILSITVMSLMMARIPFMLVDIVRAIDDGTLPYIDFGSSDLVPLDMRKHMGPELTNASPMWARRAPSLMYVYRSTCTLADKLDLEFGLKLPELNSAPILWKLTESLGGTPRHYRMAHRILRDLDMSLTISRPRKFKSRSKLDIDSSDGESSAPGLTDFEHLAGESLTPAQLLRKRTILAMPRRWKGTMCPPELRLLVAVIMVFKMAHGLDGRERSAKIGTDPSVGMANKVAWIGELASRLGHEAFQRASLDTKPLTFGTEDDMDAFLDQAQRIMLQRRDTTPAPNQAIVDMFPLPEPSSRVSKEEPSWEKFHAEASQIEVDPNMHTYAKRNYRPVILDASMRRNKAGAGRKPLPRPPPDPGQDYPVYKTYDNSILPSDMHLLIEAASRLVGLTPEDVLEELRIVEKRLERWLRPDRHNERRRYVRKSGSGISTPVSMSDADNDTFDEA